MTAPGGNPRGPFWHIGYLVSMCQVTQGHLFALFGLLVFEFEAGLLGLQELDVVDGRFVCGVLSFPLVA